MDHANRLTYMGLDLLSPLKKFPSPRHAGFKGRKKKTSQKWERGKGGRGEGKEKITPERGSHFDVRHLLPIRGGGGGGGGGVLEKKGKRGKGEEGKELSALLGDFLHPFF